MRVAIPAFQDEVSPRFCFAPEVIVLEMEAGREVGQSRLVLRDLACPDRLRMLAGLGVSLLVCGGFDSAYLPDAERAGVHVVWGVTGSIADALRDVLAGKLGSARDHPNCWCRASGGHPNPSSNKCCPRHKRRTGHA